MVVSAIFIWPVPIALKHAIRMDGRMTAILLQAFIMTAGSVQLLTGRIMKNEVITTGTGTGIRVTRYREPGAASVRYAPLGSNKNEHPVSVYSTGAFMDSTRMKVHPEHRTPV